MAVIYIFLDASIYMELVVGEPERVLHVIAPVSFLEMRVPSSIRIGEVSWFVDRAVFRQPHEHMTALR